MNDHRLKTLGDSIGQLAALAALVGACLVVAWECWPMVGRWHQQRLAERLAAQVQAAADDQVKIPMRQLASLGKPALAHLVQAAASPRATVAERAQSEINLAFATHRAIMSNTVNEQSIAMIIELATAFADHIDRFPQDRMQWAESLALEMIDLAEQFPASASAGLLSQCSRVLESIPQRSPRQQTDGTNAGSVGTRKPVTNALPSVDLQILSTPTAQVQSAVAPQPPLAQQSPSRPQQAASEPSSTVELIPPPAGWSPQWNSYSKATPPDPPSGGSSLAVQVRTPQPPPSSARLIDVPTPREMRRRTFELRKLPTEALLKKFLREDKFTAGAIRAVLGERGLRPSEIDMTTRIESANVADRLLLVEEASQLPAASARRLLRLLLEDTVAEVRLRALTTLATTNDPGLAEMAAEIAVRDEDPRVAELASRLSRQQ